MRSRSLVAGPGLVGAILGALVLSSPSVARAYRPFDGTDADSAELGVLEVELGSAATFERGSFAQLTAPALVLNLGFFPRWELVLETNNILAQRPAGGVKDALDETHAFVKVVLRKGCLQEQSGVSIATEFGVWLPNLNGEKGVGGSFDFIFSQQIQAMTFHLNLEGARTLGGNYLMLGTLIAEGPRELPVRPVTELVAQHEFGGATAYSVLVGALWNATSAMTVDLGLRGATTDGVPSATLRLGMTLRAPLWHPEEAKPE